MGAFGELLKTYWGPGMSNEPPKKVIRPKSKKKIKKKP